MNQEIQPLYKWKKMGENQMRSRGGRGGRGCRVDVG